MEFGEKVKQLREEKGMTQQKLAEKLYVTRQAVSRWECGARYPDLLTAKKIAQILEVSMDEMLSGEELKRNVEKEPVLAKPVENILQTVLYTIAAVAYLLTSIFGIYSFIPREALGKTPVGIISLPEIVTVCGYVLNLLAVLIGLRLSAGNRLTAKVTGAIMCLPYVIAGGLFLSTYIEMQIKQNGHVGLDYWITNILLPFLFAACVLLFFVLEDQRIPYGVILLICGISTFSIFRLTRLSIKRGTDLGFVVRMVHFLGEMGMVVLLAYQAYIWNRKKKKAIKSP